MSANKQIFGILHTMDQPIESALEEYQKLLHEKDQIIDRKSEVIDELKKRIAILEAYLRLEKQKRFGRSSERNEAQGELFNEVEMVSDETQESIEDEETPVKERKKPGRKGLSQNIPRVQVHIDLPDEEKEGAIDTFYTKTREELDIEPAKVRVLEYMQEKAVFIDDGNRSIKTAEMPKHPIAKSMASIGLLTYLIVAKYMDGLPLHRLESIIKRYGGEVTRATMANWLIRLSIQLQPLIHLMRAHQHSGLLINADETRIQVLKEPGYSATSDKQIWVTRGGPPGKPSVLFEYDPSRSKEVVERLLGGYEGAIQTDGYAGYNAVCETQGNIHLGCWDHARRKFKEAQDAQPKKRKKGSKMTKADVALVKIKKLYMIERKIKTMSTQGKYEHRQKNSIPVLNDIRAWLDKNLGTTPDDELITKAMVYLHNQWPKLIRYCENGDYPISNVIVENAIRPFVIGRKAWLFADTPKGARASAIYYSLIETAKANDLEPYAYLKYVFKALPYADTVEKLEELMPWKVKERLNVKSSDKIAA